jgi:uncharacterized protein (TIGR03067 family)
MMLPQTAWERLSASEGEVRVMLLKFARLLLFLVAVPVSAAETSTEAARLAGTWIALEAQRDGAPDPEALGHRLTFAANRFTIEAKGKLLYAGTYTLDPAAEPARIDFRHDEGEAKGTVWEGIYRLEGEGLVICDDAFDPKRERPTQFTTSPSSGHVLITFGRNR